MATPPIPVTKQCIPSSRNIITNPSPITEESTIPHTLKNLPGFFSWNGIPIPSIIYSSYHQRPPRNCQTNPSCSLINPNFLFHKMNTQIETSTQKKILHKKKKKANELLQHRKALLTLVPPSKGLGLHSLA